MNLFENMLILYCAPTLLGVKQSNLFSCSIEQKEDLLNEISIYNNFLNQKDIYFKLLYEYKDRVFILVYRKTKMFSYITDRKVSYFLNKEGYTVSKNINNIDNILEYLGKRIVNSEDFPHEIGFFLGYPKQDVFKYIENSGKNYKFYGYWKVYEDEKRAKKIFWQYNKCKEVMERKSKFGLTVLNVLGIN